MAVFTARRYASAAYAVVMCTIAVRPSVCPSQLHKSVFHRNGRLKITQISSAVAMSVDFSAAVSVLGCFSAHSLHRTPLCTLCCYTLISILQMRYWW